MQEVEGVIKYQLHHTFSIASQLGDISTINVWRTLCYRLQLIGQQNDRYMGYGYGNISNRFKDNQFIISGTQTGGIPVLSREHYCLVKATDLSSNTLYSSGPSKPSSEALSHASIYSQDTNIQCIIHAHNPDIWQATQALKLAHTGKKIAYGTPDMAYAINKLFQSGQLKQQPLFTLLGHEDGVISFGRDFPEAAFAMINTLANAMQLRLNS